MHEASRPVAGSAPAYPHLHELTPRQLRARRSAKWSTFPEDVLPMWVAEMDFPLAAPVRAAVHAAAGAESFGYPAQSVMRELARAAADWQREAYGWQVDPEGIFVLGDVMHGVELAVEQLCGPDDPVVIPSPAYPPFFSVVALTGRPQVRLPMASREGRWRLDLAGIDAALGAGARAVLLCNPHNPLGRVFGRAELLALAAVVDRHGAWVISDEIHAPLAFAGPHLPYASLSSQTAAHTVTLVSASKAWNLPGLKCAQVITSSPRVAERWRRIPFWRTVGVSTLGMEASLAAYRLGAPWLGEVTVTLAEHAALVVDAVAGMPGVRTTANEGTYLQWLDFTALDLDEEPASWLRRVASVALNDGPSFGVAAHGFARLNYATPRPLLQEGLARIEQAVRARSR
ncbi:MAG: MalY/PatB family protein [Dermatophilaceae bacterium]